MVTKRHARLMFWLLWLVAACSAGRDSTAPTTTTTTSIAPTTTSTTTTLPTVEDQVRAAWDAYWSMVERLLQAPDPNDPELGLRAVDPVLSFLRDDLADRQAQGHIVIFRPGGRYVHRFRAIDVQGNSAVVTGCQLDDSVTQTRTGVVVDDSITTRELSASFVLVEGAWKAADVGLTSEVEGLTGCDA